MILAYFRMKFSSLKINKDRVLDPPIPGRLMLVARLVIARRLESCWPERPSSTPASAVSVAILVNESISYLVGKPKQGTQEQHKIKIHIGALLSGVLLVVGLYGDVMSPTISFLAD